MNQSNLEILCHIKQNSSFSFVLLICVLLCLQWFDSFVNRKMFYNFDWLTNRNLNSIHKFFSFFGSIFCVVWFGFWFQSIHISSNSCIVIKKKGKTFFLRFSPSLVDELSTEYNNIWAMILINQIILVCFESFFHCSQVNFNFIFISFFHSLPLNWINGRISLFLFLVQLKLRSNNNESF